MTSPPTTRGFHHDGGDPDDRDRPDADRADGSRGRQAERPGEIPPKGWLDIARRVKSEMAEDHVSLAAAGVAYYGFLAAIPALASVVSIYGLFTDPAAVQSRIESMFGALPAEARSLMQDQLATIVGQRTGALTTGAVIGVVLSLWSASSGMGHLLEAVNVAYEETERRGWFVRKAQAVLFTVAAVLFVVAVGATIAALAWAARRLDLSGAASWALRLVWVPLVMVGFTIGLAALYRYAPDRERPRWRWVSWGSVVAVVVWVVASVGFQIYVSNFSSYNKTYGSLAAVVILLFWLYLTAYVILLGAELNAETEHQTTQDSTTGPFRPLGGRGAAMADSVGPSKP